MARRSLFNLIRSLALVACLGAPEAQAAAYRLYSAPGVAHPQYNAIVSELGPGDEVTFSNGKTYRIAAALGSESTTRVFDVGGGKAIRIPIRQGRFPLQVHGDYADFIDSYLEGYPLLRDRGVSVVQVYPEESLPRELVVVEKLDIRFLLRDFLSDSFKKRVPPEEHERLWAEFTEFARGTWAFRNIGDIREAQIAYTPRGWVLFDFSRNSSTASEVESGSIFSSDIHDMRANMAMSRGDVIPREPIYKIDLPRDRRPGILAALAEERVRRGLLVRPKCGSILGRVLSFITGT